MKTLLYWLPRLMSLIIAFAFGVFALDIFNTPEPILKKIGGLTIHLIPVLLLILIVLFTWKKSFWGFTQFTLLFAISIIYFRSYKHSLNFTIFSLPLLIIALLYLADYFFGKKR